MLIKNLLRIVKSYKLSLITIIFYEIIYLLKGFKGNKFHISKNQKMTNNFPCPYYFLIKIEKTLKKNNFNTFIDLGCGSGRVIDFLKRIKNSERLKKNSIFIFVNCDKKLLNSFNEVECITSYYINNTKGYSIYQFGKQE